MATIKLFNNYSNNNVINKNISPAGTFTGYFRTEIDILNPVFDLQLNELPVCNYCYIEEFQRYYFCSITAKTNTVFTFNCSIDVLMSWQNAILNSDVLINRSSDRFDIYLNDELQKNEGKTISQYKNFNNVVESETSFYLLVAGR